MRIVAAYMKRTSHPVMSSAENTAAAIAEPKKPHNPPHEQYQVNHITVEELDGFPVYSVVPATDEPRDTPRDIVIYVHGGAFFRELTKYHWTLVSDIAAAGFKVVVPVYGLLPDHDAEDAYPFIREVWRRAAAEAEASGHTVSIAGDSAGGGLAAGCVLRFAGEDAAELPAPSRMALIAPWLDLTVSDPRVEEIGPRDPWLHPTGLRVAGEAWGRRSGEQDVLTTPCRPILPCSPPCRRPGSGRAAGTSCTPMPAHLRRPPAVTSRWSPTPCTPTHWCRPRKGPPDAARSSAGYRPQGVRMGHHCPAAVPISGIV